MSKVTEQRNIQAKMFNPERVLIMEMEFKWADVKERKN